MKGNGEKILGCCRIAAQAIHYWIISNAPFNNIEISFQSLCQTRHRVDRNSKRHWFVCCRLQVAPIMPQGSRLENIFRAGVMDATWRLWSTRKELAGWCFLLPVAWS
jgi:hypothetical protein